MNHLSSHLSIPALTNHTRQTCLLETKEQHTYSILSFSGLGATLYNPKELSLTATHTQSHKINLFIRLHYSYNYSYYPCHQSYKLNYIVVNVY